MQETPFLLTVFNWLAVTFVFVVGLVALAVVAIYILDVTQTRQAIRRNYPVIGRLRYLFEHLGKFFRQYFFAMDREELPFNRAERSWAYQAAKNVDTTAAFGSTRDLRPPGTVYFVNCPFPTLDRDAVPTTGITIGPYCRQPYTTESLFNISALSYGAVSRPAVQALSRGAAMAGCWLNTGEGGLAPYHLEGGADLVFQIGTAKYGVRDEQGRLSDKKLREVAAHEVVKMFEIKLSQGAKPGKGGILPGEKVTAEIARVRAVPEGEDSISPNRHIEVDTVGELLDFIARIREVTGKPVGIKSVIGAYGWLDDLCNEIHRRGVESAPDFFSVDSCDGGSGAAPMSLLDNMGLPLKESLPRVVDTLAAHGLRERVRVIASGKLITPVETTWALCAGADFINCGRGFMFALGCIQAMQCNKNTCPTGVTTHDPRLQKGLDPADKSVRVANYCRNMVHEIGVIAHACGVHEPRLLRRYHARIVCPDGSSMSLDEAYGSRMPAWEPHAAHTAGRVPSA